MRAYYSHYLMIMGRPNEALAQMERALDLDPFNPLFHALHGVLLQYGLRRYDDAIEQFRSELRTVPDHPTALSMLVQAFYAKGLYEETFEAAKANHAASGNTEGVNALERGYAEAGFRRAMIRADWWAAHSPGAGAFNYITAGMNQQALDCLESGFENRDPNTPYIGVMPYHDSLRNEPRFQDLLRRMNFPEDVLAGYLNETR